jgi:hypothetical protein
MALSQKSDSRKPLRFPQIVRAPAQMPLLVVNCVLKKHAVAFFRLKPLTQVNSGEWFNIYLKDSGKLSTAL